MNRYIKLLNWEIHRFSKLYAVLWLVTLLSQLAGVLLFAKNHMNRVKDGMGAESLTLTEFIDRRGKVSFDHYSDSSLFFMGPIALCAAAILLYVFLIWYREWFGKNTFAYRLFMLPTSRMNIYMAKTTAIILFVLGLVAFQLVTLPLQMLVFNSIIPSEIRVPVSVMEMVIQNQFLSIIVPSNFIDFMLHYSIGLMGVFIMFTSILLERSFRIKGLVAGVAYAALAVCLFFSPVLITDTWFSDYFYPRELFLMEVGVGILIICGSLWFSSFLINKKVTV
jgi:hypothetical protein